MMVQNYTKFFTIQGQFDFEGQGHQLSNTSEIFRCSLNSLNVKTKFQIGQFKSLKQIFCKFEGQFDLEGQDLQIIEFEGKIHNGSKVVAFTRNYTKFLSFKPNLTLKVKVTSFQTHPRYLDAHSTV